MSGVRTRRAAGGSAVCRHLRVRVLVCDDRGTQVSKSVAVRGGRDTEIMAGKSLKSSKSYVQQTSTMPPVTGEHVVTVHAVARMLGWSARRVRRLDDILRPIRLADGSRAYDVERVLFFVHVLDSAPTHLPTVVDLKVRASQVVTGWTNRLVTSGSTSTSLPPIPRHCFVPTHMKIESARTDAIEALAPHVERVLRALAVLCDAPDFVEAFVTDESWLSDFGVTKNDYPRLSEMLGVPIDPEDADDRVIHRIAAKLKERERRARG